jgi:hypothetical protein
LTLHRRLALLIIGALVLGVIAQSIGDTPVARRGSRSLLRRLMASEITVRWRDVQPVVGGWALLIIGALLLGIGVDAGIRAESHGSYRRHAHT